jgi:hypothetical protein
VETQIEQIEVREIRGSSFWYFAAVASGFVTISTQVSWTRILTMVIGSSTYAFSIVVALFLIGLAGGAWFVARKDRSTKLRETMTVVELLTAVSLFVSLYVVNWLPWVLVNLGTNLHVSSWAGLLGLQITSATLLILVPALLMGMVMPLVLEWAAPDPDAGVARVGRRMRINTIARCAGVLDRLRPDSETSTSCAVLARPCASCCRSRFQPSETRGGRSGVEAQPGDWRDPVVVLLMFDLARA